MEQAPYWIWTNPKPNNSTSGVLNQQRQLQAATGASFKIPMAYNDGSWSSWEEQAFAEDATGAFGGGSGCIWPPRSYSCSFCGREFRSAQALGGHMNVHRRDRARLKQSSPSPDHLQSQLAHIHHQYPSPVCALVYHHPNPNCDHDHNQEIITTLAPPFSSSTIAQEHNKIRSPIPPTWANFVVDGYNNTSDPKPCNKAKVNNLNRVRTDLSVSLNLVLHQTHPTMSYHEDEAMRRCKKRRRSSTDSSSLPLFLKPNSSNQAQDCAGVDKLAHSHDTTLEDLDLELRLGGRPEVKGAYF